MDNTTAREAPAPEPQPNGTFAVPALGARISYGSAPPPTRGWAESAVATDPRPSTSRRPSTIRAGSASSRTSRAGPPTRSCGTRSRSSPTSSTAARAAPRRTPATAPGSWSSVPYRFLGAVAAEARRRRSRRAATASAMVFLPRDAASREACRERMTQSSPRRASSSSAGATCPRPRRPRRRPRAPASRSSSRRSSPGPRASASPRTSDLDFERRLYVARRLDREGRQPQRAPRPGRLLRPVDELPHRSSTRGCSTPASC